MRSLLIIPWILVLFLAGCSSGDSPITGNTVKEMEETQIETDLQPAEEEGTESEQEVDEEQVETLRFCHDTDNAITKWTKGTVKGYYNDASGFGFEDYCQNDRYVMEFYCDDDEIPRQQLFECPSGCREGACL